MMNALVQHRPATDIWHGFDRVFEDAFKPFANLTESQLTPVNVRKVEGGVEYELMVAGFAKSDIRISVEDGRIWIEATKQDRPEGYERREFSYERVKRRLNLPKNAIVDKIEAVAADGILTIKVPTETEKTQAIEVQVR